MLFCCNILAIYSAPIYCIILNSIIYMLYFTSVTIRPHHPCPSVQLVHVTILAALRFMSFLNVVLTENTNSMYLSKGDMFFSFSKRENEMTSKVSRGMRLPTMWYVRSAKAQTSQPFLVQRREENDHRNYFRINRH